MDGSSSGESCDGTVTTAVVVGPTDDDDAGDTHVLTPSAIVGPHHYITVAGKDFFLNPYIHILTSFFPYSKKK